MHTALNGALRRCRSGLGAAAVFSILINLLMLTGSLYMMQVYDRVLPSQSRATLAYLTLVALGCLTLLGILDACRARLLVRLGAWLEERLAPEAYVRALDATLAGADYRAEGLRDLALLRSFLAGSAASLFDVPWVPIYMAAIYLLHPTLGQVAMGAGAMLFVLALVNDLLTRRSLQRAAAATLRLARRTEGTLRNAEVIDAMGLLPDLTRGWAAENGAILDTQVRAADRSALVVAASKAMRQAFQIALLAAGAGLVIDHEITGGTMIAGSIVMGRALAPLEQAIGTWKQAIAARAAWHRLQGMFTRSARRRPGMRLPDPHGPLSVEGVSFRAPRTGLTILSGVSFEVHPGEALAVLGPSASGKSTLARLLVGTHRADAGCVRLAGADVAAWDRTDLGRHIGYLPQDVELFDGTVRDNIARMGNGSPEAVVEAARLAGVHDMVLRLPEGYATPVGEDGMALSGGQRQRIALARALFGRPLLVVLDEPNANLDADGEAALNRAIAAVKAAGAAVVVIGHRPSILAAVDRILILRGGRVDLLGPRIEVLESLKRSQVAPVPPNRPAIRPADGTRPIARPAP